MSDVSDPSEHQDNILVDDVPIESIDLKSPREALRPQKLPKAPKRSRHARNRWVIIFNFFFSVIMLALVVLGVGFFWGSKEYVAVGPLEKTVKVLVPRGASTRDIGDALARSKVIKSPLIFWATVRLQKKQGELKAGEYIFEKGATMRDVLAKLVKGKAVIYKVTVPEGLTSLQIVEILRADKILTGDINEIPEEGSLLPNTYTFGRGTSRMQIIRLMQQEQIKSLKRIWANRVDGLPVKTPEELVILASIVEKETAKSDERPRVAAVFINRLRQGIKLQSDPTIIYGLFGGGGKPKDRPIYKSDIEKPTDYNTYTIPALPPGPISNPGIAAMEAVANPSLTDELYFVADGTGGHAFAKTLKEHNNNVRNWRRIEKERKEKKSKEEAPKEPKEESTPAPN
ncbi:MAG: endolytic transglycosylase MltG [Hyphomicrobiales bacterium]